MTHSAAGAFLRRGFEGYLRLFERHRTGLFDTGEKSPFFAANIAYVPYCTSDAWAGDRAPSEARIRVHPPHPTRTPTRTPRPPATPVHCPSCQGAGRTPTHHDLPTRFFLFKISNPPP